MNEQLTKLAQQANIEFTYDPTEIPARAFVECWEDELEKFAELVWKAAYEEGHDVGVDAGFEAGRNASFTEQNFGVEE